VYDAVENGFAIFVRCTSPANLNDESERFTCNIPFGFRGAARTTFFNSPTGRNQQFRPYVSIALF